jgi:hypothetical protein
MNLSHYEEHIAHSAPCNSRWDGFDRGDLGRTSVDACDIGQRVIGRMTSEGGYRVVVTEFWCDMDSVFEVHVDGKRVHSTDDRAQAITVARWWMAGCPA